MSCGGPGLELRQRGRLTQALGLDDGQTGLRRELLDGRCFQLVPAAGGPIGLGDHAHDRVRFGQRAQRGTANVGVPMKTIRAICNIK